jgi:acyl carrier protein
VTVDQSLGGGQPAGQPGTQRIIGDIAAMLSEVVGEDIGDLLPAGAITAATTFNEDLSLESIEFVMLAEKLREHYGSGVDLTAFVAGMDIDEIMTMTVGQLAAHIERSLSG